MAGKYKICSRCIMDTTAPNIIFNEKGECNFCSEYLETIKRLNVHKKEREKRLKDLINEIKKQSKNQEYDCVLGISGGLDSSFALYKAVQLGLKPLAVHLDNGWNSDMSVKNIESLVRGLNVDLYTHVINWEEFRDLQRAFFKANVIDIEMVSDHAIIASLYKAAAENKTLYILSGGNFANEGMLMPEGWNHLKIDLKNLKAIYNRFGMGKRLKTFPTISLAHWLKYKYLNKIMWLSFLDYVPYTQKESAEILSKEFCWKAPEKKHYESIITRFYQAYILPKKFNVDKRKLHYSSLICSGQLSREDALEKMMDNPYGDISLLEEDKKYVLKKLNFNAEYFEEYINSPPIPHTYYPSNTKLYFRLKSLKRIAGI